MGIHEVTLTVLCGCGAPIMAHYGEAFGESNTVLRVGPCHSCRDACIKEFKDKAREMAGQDLQRELVELRQRAERAEKLSKGEPVQRVRR